ncbi:hypothetical protein J2847_005059 [Azospirillum agricola]|uniref:DUF4391 domain-containing protein n=1 Tax=Azospirillum agricola TaxID=1720247 RepID=UPI001AE212A3|nr:DUF4391 domain-containing protein [Azospirillum agricola]MBP2231740.1 hypothetical protein [Azospirillum agricola]
MTLFAYPPATLVNRVLPKNKIYANATVSAKLREAFVTELHQVTWRAKLAPETVRLAATPMVPEIQIFELALRQTDLNEAILRTIDDAIPFPILFELHFGGKARTLAAWKRPSEAVAGKWVTGTYLATPWVPADSSRQGLPVALDMASLYERMLGVLTPLPSRRGETLRDHMERLEQVRGLEVELGKLERRLAQERQFNRKVEINSKLRAVKDDIARLSAQQETQD